MAGIFRIVLPLVAAIIVACTPRTIAQEPPQWEPGDTVLTYTPPGDEGQVAWPEPSPHLSFIPSEVSFWCSSDSIENCEQRILTITNYTDCHVDITDAFIIEGSGWLAEGGTEHFTVHYTPTTLKVGDSMEIIVEFSYSTVLKQATLVVLSTFTDQATTEIPLAGKIFIW